MTFFVAVRGDLARSRTTMQRRAAGRISDRAPNVRPWEARRRRPSRTKENDMRAILIAALVGLGIGVCAGLPSLAAPASGAATATAAEFARPVEQAYWRSYRHRHRWRHHWHHRWWY